MENPGDFLVRSKRNKYFLIGPRRKSMTIQQKMLRAYFKAAEAMQQGEPYLVCTTEYFHRTKKVVFSIIATRLNKAGLLPGERRL